MKNPRTFSEAEALLRKAESNPVALSMPFASPTGYGLGKSGWVTAAFSKPAEVPMALLLSWLEESYRAVAPKRLAASLARTFVALCSLLAASGCAPSTRCTVENRSASALTQVVVTGAGFAAPVPDLAPGAAATVTLRPRGEAGELTVVFVAEGREHRHVEPAYFEARGYSVHVTVDSRLAVTVRVEVAGMGKPSYG